MDGGRDPGVASPRVEQRVDLPVSGEHRLYLAQEHGIADARARREGRPHPRRLLESGFEDRPHLREVCRVQVLPRVITSSSPGREVILCALQAGPNPTEI